MEYIYGPHIAATARVRTCQDSRGVCKLVQCVSIQYTADMHFKAYNGFELQERDVFANASETKDFPNEVSLFLKSDFCHSLSC